MTVRTSRLSGIHAPMHMHPRLLATHVEQVLSGGYTRYNGFGRSVAGTSPWPTQDAHSEDRDTLSTISLIRPAPGSRKDDNESCWWTESTRADPKAIPKSNNEPATWVRLLIAHSCYCISVFADMLDQEIREQGSR